MKALLLSVSLAVFASVSFNAQAGVEVERLEVEQRELDFQLAPIKSSVNARSHLARTPAGSPLSLLSPGARQRFVQSLVFTKTGLATYDYRDISAELTAVQAYNLLALFGAQRSVSSIPGLRGSTPSDALIRDGAGVGIMTDYADYWCSSGGTCSQRMGSICIGNNCSKP